jgi:hypothetical protein
MLKRRDVFLGLAGLGAVATLGRSVFGGEADVAAETVHGTVRGLSWNGVRTFRGVL